MKKKRIKLLGVVLLAGMLTMLSACSNKEKEQEAASSTSAWAALPASTMWALRISA